jgi:phage terminase small subunit
VTDELKPLSKKHQRVLDEYLICFNQTRAYQKIYPKTTYDSAKALASNLFTDVNFSAHLQARLNEAHMQADEALKLMTDIARGDIAQLMEVSSVGFNLDMSKAQELGLTHLIKKVKQKTTLYIAKKESDDDREVTELEIELYDKQAAIRDFLKLHGKLSERVDVTSGGEALGKDDSDTRAEILRKLDGIATAVNSSNVRKQSDE